MLPARARWRWNHPVSHIHRRLPGAPADSVRVKALENWQQQDLAPESRARLRELIDVQRHDPDDHDRRDALLEAFLFTLSEHQLIAFARLLREMTEQVH